MSKGILIFDEKPTWCHQCLLRSDDFETLYLEYGYEPDDVTVWCAFTGKELTPKEQASIPDWCPIQKAKKEDNYNIGFQDGYNACKNKIDDWSKENK